MEQQCRIQPIASKHLFLPFLASGALLSLLKNVYTNVQNFSLFISNFSEPMVKAQGNKQKYSSKIQNVVVAAAAVATADKIDLKLKAAEKRIQLTSEELGNCITLITHHS